MSALVNDTSVAGTVMRLAARQERAVSRSQVLAAGGTADWIASQVRKRSWQRLWPGVYATVTGPVPFMTRAYGALLYAGPGAVLGPHASALLNGMESRPPRTVDVLLPPGRRARRQPRLDVRRAQLPGRSFGHLRDCPAQRLPLRSSRLRARPTRSWPSCAQPCGPG